MFFCRVRLAATDFRSFNAITLLMLNPDNAPFHHTQNHPFPRKNWLPPKARYVTLSPCGTLSPCSIDQALVSCETSPALREIVFRGSVPYDLVVNHPSAPR